MINNQIHLCQKLITMLLKIHLLKKTQEEGSSKAEKEVKEKAKKKAKGKKRASEKEKTKESKNTKKKVRGKAMKKKMKLNLTEEKTYSLCKGTMSMGLMGL